METPRVMRGLLCSALGKCLLQKELQKWENIGNKRTTTNYSFMYKVALPEIKSLTDECKTPSLEHAGLAWQGRVGERSPWEPQGHAEFWNSPNPIWSPHRLSPLSPKAFPATAGLQYDDVTVSYVECGVLSQTQQKTEMPCSAMGVVVGFLPTPPSHQPRETLACLVASDLRLSRRFLSCSLSRP